MASKGIDVTDVSDKTYNETNLELYLSKYDSFNEYGPVYSGWNKPLSPEAVKQLVVQRIEASLSQKATEINLEDLNIRENVFLEAYAIANQDYKLENKLGYMLNYQIHKNEMDCVTKVNFEYVPMDKWAPQITNPTP